MHEITERTFYLISLENLACIAVVQASRYYQAEDLFVEMGHNIYDCIIDDRPDSFHGFSPEVLKRLKAAPDWPTR